MNCPCDPKPRIKRYLSFDGKWIWGVHTAPPARISGSLWMAALKWCCVANDRETRARRSWIAEAGKPEQVAA